MNYITFDIETYHADHLDEFNTERFNVSVLGAYFSWIDEYVVFLEDQVKDFLALLAEVELVVGYNHINFDFAVLQKYSSFDLLSLSSYDLMVEFQKKTGFRIKLDELCKANLGTQKTDSFENYADYYWDKQFFKLADYCLNDVRLTQELFEKVLQTKTLVYEDLQGQKEVVFESPAPKKAKISKQGIPVSIF